MALVFIKIRAFETKKINGCLIMKKKMNQLWSELKDIEQLDELVTLSDSTPVFIFKHSVSCGISAQAKENLEIAMAKTDKKIIFYYLDLIKYRSISNEIASRFGVTHQSPQILFIKGGKVIFTTSHHKIRPDIIEESLSLQT
jgi:bacillithiol system protein YtxJ